MSAVNPSKPAHAAADAFSTAATAAKPATQAAAFKERYTKELTKMLSQLVLLR